MVSSLLLLLTINSLEIGTQFGPIFPTGSLANTYQVSTTAGLFTSMNNFDLGYSYSKFASKLNTSENLFLHTIMLSYQYPFYKINNSQFLAILGANYNRIIHSLDIANEQNSVFSLRYGLGFKQNFAISKSLRPALLAQLNLNHILQMRSWNYSELLYSNLFISVTAGISFSFL
jgi:hypothetical protein